MRISRACLAATAVMIGAGLEGGSFAQGAGDAPPPALAEILEDCAACHGADGMGDPALQAPRLAGQGARYLAEQLSHFAEGRRGADAADAPGSTMAAAAAELDEAEILALARHYSTLASPPPGAAALRDAGALEAAGPAARGAAFFRDNCAACHGGAAQGADILYTPNLALLDAAYLRRQIENFRAGRRGGEGASSRAKGMRELAFLLDDDAALEDLAAFLFGVEAR